jgi:hypothetical protein
LLERSNLVILTFAVVDENGDIVAFDNNSLAIYRYEGETEPSLRDAMQEIFGLELLTEKAEGSTLLRVVLMEVVKKSPPLEIFVAA